MKKLFNFLLVLVIGVILGYVFHNPIDVKLKEKFGNNRIEAAKDKVEDVGEKAYDAGKAGVNAVKKELDSTKID